MLPQLNDLEVVRLYRAYSEDRYAASFMGLEDGDELPEDFLEWLQETPQEKLTDYEGDLVRRWRLLEERQKNQK